MIRLLWRTDIHFSEFTPRFRKDSWMETLVNKIEWVGELARKLNVDAVIDGGDFFDIKSPSRNSHRLVQEAIKAHKNYPCPVYCNVGNHDCKYGDYAFLPEQPLGVLYEANVFRPLYDNHEALFTTPTETVRVVGVPYHGVRYDHERFRIAKGTETHLVVAAHVLASRNGGTMFDAEDVISYPEFVELCPEAAFACFGHWHMDQGIEEHGGVTFVNVGSLSRGSLSQDNLERNPAVVLMEFDGESARYTRYNLPVRPATEVFAIEAKEAIAEKESVMESFMSTIASSISHSQGMSLRDRIGSLSGVLPEVRERAQMYLEQTESAWKK
jgi:DNA repair protein SbcD/Mre11